MKKLFSLILFLSFSIILFANDNSQESTIEKNGYGAELKESKFGLGLELSTKYIWRGQEYGTSPTMFPSLSYSNKGFSIGALGAYNFNDTHQELDLYVSYGFKGLSISVTDYYYPTAVGENDSYFTFNKNTGHMLEGTISFEHERVPVWILASTFFAGADKNLEGKQAWSSYAEIGTHYDFLENNSISVAVGAALNKSFYNNFETGFSIVNIALKYTYNVEFNSGWILPLSTSYVINPQKEKSYLNVSAAISF